MCNESIVSVSILSRESLYPSLNTKFLNKGVLQQLQHNKQSYITIYNAGSPMINRYRQLADD